MEIEFKMPDLATTDSEIKVIRWLVAPGEAIKRGQALLEVETDKAMMEVESIATGTLKAASVKVGDGIVAGQLIAVIESDAIAAKPATPPAPAAPGPASAPTHLPAGGMFAKNRAASAKAAVESGPAKLALTATQRTVGRRLQESKQNAPHFYLQASANAEPMLRARTAAAPAKIAWDAFFAQAVGRALKKFNRMACRFEADHLVPATTADVGVAVDHEGELYVVALADPSAKSAAEISQELRGKVERLRAGDPEARKLRSAAMTVTNLGATRVEAFTAIISPPEAAILAIGRVAPTAIVEAGGIVAQNRVTLTLSADHRVVNGKYAADFLTEIIRELESL
ncbi:MAG: pdhC 1 [Verrucomicrobia bacterium]|nr:pdhC 1 [Verrucomicrobiota bacterium]